MDYGGSSLKGLRPLLFNYSSYLMKSKITILLLFICTLGGYAQFQPASYMINGYTLPYQVMFPKDYNASKQYPLLVFLHGAGERGNDNEKQLTHGKDFLINNFQSAYPAIVIVPQCPESSYWANVEKSVIAGQTFFRFGLSNQPTQAMETLVGLINSWLSSGKVNAKQVYAGGLSMGGMGTYELLWRMPETFAAAFAICGGGDVGKILHSTKNTALWIFHGSDDSVVPVHFSQDMYNQLKSAGNEVKYTEYPGVNHGSWENVFKSTDLIPWLYSHKK